MLCFAAFIALFGAAFAGPIMLKGMDLMESDCVQKCTIEFRSSTKHVEFAKVTDYGGQLVNLNKTCSAVAEGQACIEKCDVLVNPLDVPAMRVMCDDRRRAEVALHETCYIGNHKHVNMICDDKCGAHLTSPINSDGNPRKPTLEETATACTRSRCHATCSRDAFTKLCAETDPEAGPYLQQFFIEVLESFDQGLEQAGLIPYVKKTMPKECHIMLKPLQFFGLSDVSSVWQDEEDRTSPTRG